VRDYGDPDDATSTQHVRLHGALGMRPFVDGGGAIYQTMIPVTETYFLSVVRRRYAFYRNYTAVHGALDGGERR